MREGFELCDPTTRLCGHEMRYPSMLFMVAAHVDDVCQIGRITARSYDNPTVY